MIQSTLDFNRRDRDKGIQKAVSSAERVAPGWAEECYKFFKVFLSYQKQGAEFQCETFEAFARNVVGTPPHLRAYGGIMLRAAREGLIKKVGMSPVSRKSSHLANSTVWSKI